MSLSEMLFDGALAPETLCDADVWDRAKIDRLHTNSTQTITKTGLELFFRNVVSSEWFKGQSQLLATTPGKRTGYRNSLAVSTVKVTAQYQLRGNLREYQNAERPTICHNLVMCGRYRLSRRKQMIEEYFGTVSGEDDWNPRYKNIAPTQSVPVIRRNPKEPRRELSLLRWGLIPSWAKIHQLPSR